MWNFLKIIGFILVFNSRWLCIIGVSFLEIAKLSVINKCHTPFLSFTMHISWTAQHSFRVFVFFSLVSCHFTIMSLQLKKQMIPSFIQKFVCYNTSFVGILIAVSVGVQRSQYTNLSQDWENIKKISVTVKVNYCNQQLKDQRRD